MADVTITIPDAQVQRVLTAFADTFGYDPATDGTKAAFAKAQVVRFVRQTTLSYERSKAAGDALAVAQNSVAEVEVT